MRGMTLRAIAEACNGVYYGSEDNLDKQLTAVKCGMADCLLPYVARELTDTNT